MSDLKPIQTWWNGLYFRSRLEARWAVFYDRLEIKYEYEKEGYDLGDGIWYLPDFWLPEQRCFVEVKPEPPNLEAQMKAERLAARAGCLVYIAFGPIGSIDSTDYPNLHNVCFGDGSWDYDYEWCRCKCGRYGIEFSGRNDRICRHDGTDKYHVSDDEPIFVAYRIARAWRFEDSGPIVWTTETDPRTGRTYARRPRADENGSGSNTPQAADAVSISGKSDR